MRYKCENDYCNFCCEKTVPWTNKLHLYSCKKQCSTFAKDAKNKKPVKSWKGCIDVDHPNYSIYGYCDDNFKNTMDASKCKIDSCRLCCVTLDEMKHTNMSMKSLKKMF